MSENSSALTRVTEPASADSMSGNRSVIPPGWMPGAVKCRSPAPAGLVHAVAFVDLAGRTTRAG
jgi:hypothetical protein